MNIKQVTAPTDEPVSLDEFKAHINGISESDTDSDITVKLLAAREYVEDETGRRLLTSTWDLFLPYFPNAAEIQLPFGNLQSVEYIKYRDIAGTEYTVDPSTYIAVTQEEPARIVLGYSQIWPVTILQPGSAVTIRFTCGWTDASLVPPRIKQAIMMLAAYWYRNREAAVTGNRAMSIEVDFSVSNLLRGQHLWKC